MRFLQFVDELAPQHFLVLTYSGDPAGWFGAQGIDRAEYYSASRKAAVSEAQLHIGGAELDLIVDDLNARRLVDGGMLGGMVSKVAVYDPWIAPLGRQLLDFVTVF